MGSKEPVVEQHTRPVTLASVTGRLAVRKQMVRFSELAKEIELAEKESGYHIERVMSGILFYIAPNELHECEKCRTAVGVSNTVIMIEAVYIGEKETFIFCQNRCMLNYYVKNAIGQKVHPFRWI